MSITTLTLYTWLSAVVAANPWGQPVCATPNTPSGSSHGPASSELGSFKAAFEDLELASKRLEDSLGGERDLEAEHQTMEALSRLRFFPREVALDPGADAQINESLALLAAHALASDPDSGAAQDWAHLALARHGVAPIDVHRLGPDVDLLFTTTQQALATANTAMIRINCDSACTAFVDGEPVSVGSYAEVNLSPGTHDVWVFDADSPQRGIYEAIELSPGQQRCVIFSAIGQALPTRAQWWAAIDFSTRLEDALWCKNNTTTVTPDPLALVVNEWPAHALVLSRNRWLRRLLARGLLNLANLHVVTTQTNLATSPSGAPANVRSAVPMFASIPGPAPQVVAIDMSLQMGRFDPGIPVRKLAAPLGPINELFNQRATRATTRSATISITCYQSCWPSIMGVRVNEGIHEVAPGRYFVEIHSTNKEVRSAGGWVSVEAGMVESVTLGAPPTPPAPVPAPVDTAEPSIKTNQQYRRVAFGTAGAISLTGGALWTLAIAAGVIPNHKVLDPRAGRIYVLEPEQRLRLGLYMSGAFSVHAILATYFFVRMPRSRRPGMSLAAAGSGVLASSSILTGVGIVGGVAAANAQKSLNVVDDHLNCVDFAVGDCPREEVLSQRKTASFNTMIVGASVGASLLVSGITMLAVGVHRNNQSQSERSARRKTRAKDRSLSLLPAFGRQLTGLKLSGKF